MSGLICEGLKARAELDRETTPSPCLAWPAWLDQATRHHLIDLEQQAALGSDAPGAVGQRAKWLAHSLGALRRAFEQVDSDALALLHAVSEVVP